MLLVLGLWSLGGGRGLLLKGRGGFVVMGLDAADHVEGLGESEGGRIGVRVGGLRLCVIRFARALGGSSRFVRCFHLITSFVREDNPMFPGNKSIGICASA